MTVVVAVAAVLAAVHNSEEGKGWKEKKDSAWHNRPTSGGQCCFRGVSSLVEAQIREHLVLCKLLLANQYCTESFCMSMMFDKEVLDDTLLKRAWNFVEYLHESTTVI
jgi:hypothetical protein